MRILYGVTGCGLGHTMRARALAQHLESRGHVVKMAASGRAVDILRRHGLEVAALKSGLAWRRRLFARTSVCDGEGEQEHAETVGRSHAAQSSLSRILRLEVSWPGCF